MPLNALRAFAIAARSRNLTEAAEQLGVTHGAVSKQIVALEDWLGQSLFSRHKRTLELTPYGRILADRVGESLRGIAEACAYVRRDRTRKVISVEAPATFAMYFLLPRIKAFEAAHDGMSVWISTSVTGQQADLSRHDLVISRGELVQSTARIGAPVPLLEERLTPVGAASLLEHKPVRGPADIGGHTAIASSSRPGDWEAWFAQAGLGNPLVEGGHRFDHLHVALHAVRDGLGLTIAPSQFFGGTPDLYRMRCPLPDLVTKGKSYFAYSTPQAEARLTELFIRWLQEQCRLSEQGAPGAFA
nr:LysR substrate-binding domain-containing protein [Methylobacterium brachythecii]